MDLEGTMLSEISQWKINTVCVCVQSHMTLCSPMDYSLPGSCVHGTFQARILEWVAISFFSGSYQPRDWTHISCIVCISSSLTLSDLGSPGNRQSGGLKEMQTKKGMALAHSSWWQFQIQANGKWGSHLSFFSNKKNWGKLTLHEHFWATFWTKCMLKRLQGTCFGSNWPNRTHIEMLGHWLLRLQ